MSKVFLFISHPQPLNQIAFELCFNLSLMLYDAKFNLLASSSLAPFRHTKGEIKGFVLSLLLSLMASYNGKSYHVNMSKIE